MVPPFEKYSGSAPGPTQLVPAQTNMLSWVTNLIKVEYLMISKSMYLCQVRLLFLTSVHEPNPYTSHTP